jgi:hypothetical protein
MPLDKMKCSLLSWRMCERARPDTRRRILQLADKPLADRNLSNLGKPSRAEASINYDLLRSDVGRSI